MNLALVNQATGDKITLNDNMPIPHYEVDDEIGMLLFSYFLQCEDLPIPFSFSFKNKKTSIQNRTRTFHSKQELTNFANGFSFASDMFLMSDYLKQRAEQESEK